MAVGSLAGRALSCPCSFEGENMGHGIALTPDIATFETCPNVLVSILLKENILVLSNTYSSLVLAQSCPNSPSFQVPPKFLMLSFSG
jgi:hypothetical protein